ncbi:MAG: ATP-dependent RecD-like DNA helicase [Candidatus Aminicenantes bacterium]|nr:ATP-dependent RecD-like DNA helicase [Candidatus Aminicenantes bacterium]
MEKQPGRNTINLETFRVRIQKRIFHSETTGFGVFRVSGLPPGKSRIIVGDLLDVTEGDTLDITGRFTRHSRFGEQFRVEEYHAVMPGDFEGMTAYLSSRGIRGLGRKTAEKIVAEFGEETLKVLQDRPQELVRVKGVGRSLVEQIRTSFKDRRMLRELTVRLAPAGISTATILRIVREYGEQSLLVLESDPYSLVDSVRGVGFRIADTIARAMGISARDPRRLNRGIDHVLEQVENHYGDLFMERHRLVVAAARLLDVDEELILDAVQNQVERGRLIEERDPEPLVLSLRNHWVEAESARMLKKMVDREIPHTVPDTELSLKDVDPPLTSEQREAVHAAVSHPVTVITGGPGTGKTTIIRAVIETFAASQLRVKIAAPTGRAAKRIEEATGFPASTIHRLLKVSPETRRFTHDESNPLPVDAVVVDEFSMVDIHLFYALLRALDTRSRLVVIGDKDQLPSVGPGNVLRDMIQSGYFPLVSLHRNFRQTGDSLIVENAYRINAGDSLVLKPYDPELDFVFVRVSDPGQAASKVLGILEHLAPRYPVNSSELQILAPMYRGEAGIDRLNAVIQERFNPEPVCLSREQAGFKRGDKVMQLRNDYDRDVFNGEQGVVADFNDEEKKIVVDFDGRFTEYTTEETDDLTLAYAMSIHKSQGSEYDCVILILLPQHSVMLNREVFYTAVTRARKRLFLISHEAALHPALANSTPNRRRTRLPQRLRDVFENQPPEASDDDYGIMPL